MSILFEQLLEALDDSLDESCDKELKEDFWNPGEEFNEFVNLLNTEFDESNWNEWSQEERDNFAKQVAERYLSINPTPTPMFFEDLTDNNFHTYRRAFEELLKDSDLKEDMSARPNTDMIYHLMKTYEIPENVVLDELLRFLPDSSLEGFADYYSAEYFDSEEE